MPATRRPTHPLLLPALTLLVGLAVGWATSPFRGAQARSSDATGPLAVGPRSDAATPRAQQLPAPVETGGRTSAPVQDSAEELAAAGEADGEPAEPVEVAPASLIAELSALLRSGRVELALASDSKRLLRFTVEAYLNMRSPQEALALMHRHPEVFPPMWQRVAYTLLQSQDRAGAADAFAGMLQYGDWDTDALRNLVELDPALGLSMLEMRQGEFDEFQRIDNAPTQARLLAAAGRGEEALALLGDLAARGELTPESLEALENLPSEQAEGFLRRTLERDDSGQSAVALAELLGRDERGEEAAALLRDLLARQPGHGGALAALFAIDPQGSLAYLSGAGSDLSPGLWSQAGSALMSQGRTADAVEAWMHSLEGNLDNQEVAAALAEHAPARLWAHCERLSSNTRDDELLGDIADLYWRQGRFDEATELWRRASRIDPGDGEWSGKLRQVARGEDPLN